MKAINGTERRENPCWLDFTYQRGPLVERLRKHQAAERSNPDNFILPDGEFDFAAWERSQLSPAYRDPNEQFTTPDGEFDYEAWKKSQL
jgi:hypothetical protein